MLRFSAFFQLIDYFQVKSESDMVRDVLKSIDEWIPFVNNLRKELKLHPFDTSHFKKGSVSLVCQFFPVHGIVLLHILKKIVTGITDYVDFNYFCSFEL